MIAGLAESGKRLVQTALAPNPFSNRRGRHRIADNDVMKECALQTDALKGGIREGRADQVRLAQICANEIRAAKRRLSEVRTDQGGAVQICTIQLSAEHRRAVQSCVAQIRIG